MKRLLQDANLDGVIRIESAGTGSWHVGEPPDRRSTSVARQRGYTMSGRAAQFSPSDFDRFDYVVAMDRSNRSALQDLARGKQDTDKISLFRDWDHNGPKDADVPDPYYGGDDGFDVVLDICESGSRGLLAFLRQQVK